MASLDDGRSPKGAVASILASPGMRHAPPGRRWLRVAITGMAALAIALVVAVLLWPYLWPGDSRMRLSGVLPEMSLGPDTQAMIEADYASVDKAGRPYTIVADVIRSVGDTEDQLELVAPHGTLTLDDGGKATLTAAIGHYDRTAERMDLEGDVRLTLRDEYRVDTSLASIDLQASAASGSAPVTATGDFGTINAEGFKVMDGGKTVLFTGQSRMILNGQRAVLPQ
jgi:lipopolysaccharide export system protein LptC